MEHLEHQKIKMFQKMFQRKTLINQYFFRKIVYYGTNGTFYKENFVIEIYFKFSFFLYL